MDPSANLCLLRDSFNEQLPLVTATNWYTNTNDIPLTANYAKVSVNSAPAPLHADGNRYNVLQKVKDSFDTEGFIDARNNTNPFEYIGRSIFINRAAVKLSNIDAVQHVTNNIFTFDEKQSDNNFTFCDVAAGPGGFTQYLQYRYPKAIGYGMTLRHEQLDWSTRFLDMKRFTPVYGYDNSGNLYTQWDAFIEYVLKQQPSGVNLVTADGGFDLEDGMDKTLLHRQEFLSSRLLLTQAVVGVGCTKIGGNFVLKVFDTVTNFSAQVLYVLSRCFDKITVFKPVTSRPANAERYVVCLGKKSNVGAYYNLLRGAAQAYTDTEYLDSIFNEMLPEDFVTWMRDLNTESINMQLQYARNILSYLQGKELDLPRYDVDKFLIIWNLPDTPPKPKRVQRK